MRRHRLLALLQMDSAGHALGRGWLLVWLSGLTLFAAAIALSWSNQPYWMDADEYALFLSIGRWAVHPPGYILFMVLGRALFALGFAGPYGTLQVVCLASSLTGMLLLYRLLRTVLTPLRASVLVFTFALSWVPLLINHTGTSCTADLFTVPLVLWAAVRFSERPTRPAAAWLCAALVICGGFRLTTLLMMVPLLGAVLWRNRRHACVWVAVVVVVLVVALLQVLTIRALGGWDMYRFMVWKENFVNRTYIESAFIARALFNLGRCLLWLVLATLGLWFALLRMRSPQPWTARQRMLSLYGALASAGPLVVCALYLCEHPGYVAPALAGIYLCVAVAWDRAHGQPGFGKWPVIAVMVSLALFFGLRFFRTPATPAQAAANGLLLQYSADAARHAYFLSTAEWLRLFRELGPSP